MTLHLAVLEPKSDRSAGRSRTRRLTHVVEVAAASPHTRAVAPLTSMDGSSIRARRVRAAIECGMYDNPALLDAALDRMIDAVIAHESSR